MVCMLNPHETHIHVSVIKFYDEKSTFVSIFFCNLIKINSLWT